MLGQPVVTSEVLFCSSAKLHNSEVREVDMHARYMPEEVRQHHVQAHISVISFTSVYTQYKYTYNCEQC